MKILLKLLLFISFFFAIGLMLAKIGLFLPGWKYPSTFWGWVILIILIFLLDIFAEFIGNKINDKFGFRFWENFNEKEVKTINKIIITVLAAIVFFAVIFGMLK